MDKHAEKISTYSLSLEELALTLGMINRPDLERLLLLSVYPSQNAQQIEARLISASHSLLARDLCSLSSAKIPILDKDLQTAVFPLALYDSLLQINVVEGKKRFDARVHIQSGKSFSAHRTLNEVIHEIDHGEIHVFPTYVKDRLGEFTKTVDAGRMTGKIEIGLLDRAQEGSHPAKDIVHTLVKSGWSKADANLLSEDLTAQVLRATFAQFDIPPSMSLGDAKVTPRKMLLFLKGKCRSWSFEFLPPGSLTGEASLVDQLTFEKAFAKFMTS